MTNEESFNEWERKIPDELRQILSNFAIEHTYPVRGILRNLFNAARDAAREDEVVGFAEWISDNQFTRYNHEWTSTKIHYSGCVYTTTELYQLYLKHKNEKL